MEQVSRKIEKTEGRGEGIREKAIRKKIIDLGKRKTEIRKVLALSREK